MILPVGVDHKFTYPPHQDDAVFEVAQLAIREKNQFLGRRMLSAALDRATKLGIHPSSETYQSVDRSLERLKEIGLGIPELSTESAQALISFVQLNEKNEGMSSSDVANAIDNAAAVICRIENPTDKLLTTELIGADIMRNIWRYDREFASRAAWALEKIARSERGRAQSDDYLLDRIHYRLWLNQLPFTQELGEEPSWHYWRRRACADRLADFRKMFPGKTNPQVGMPAAD